VFCGCAARRVTVLLTTVLPPPYSGWRAAFACSTQVTYVSYAQGFIWNPEIFVPSYCDFDYVPLEQRRDPVIEIHVSDEDARRILPHSS